MIEYSKLFSMFTYLFGAPEIDTIEVDGAKTYYGMDIGPFAAVCDETKLGAKVFVLVRHPKKKR
jgi:hypothetical protein